MSRRRIQLFKTAPTKSIMAHIRQGAESNSLRPSMPLAPMSSPPDAAVRLEERMSLDEKVYFVSKMAEVVFITEFLVLIEFAEDFVPVIYSIFILVMVKLPNRKFYPLLVSELDAQHVTANILNVLMYSVLEFASFLLITALLTRKLHFSAFHQLVFVLDRQWTVVQAKFVIWTFFVIQSYLTHFGVDYSMEFAWLHRPHTT